MRPTAPLPILFALAALGLAAPAHAQSERTLTPDKFERMVVGRTLHFDRYGEAFGAEQYFDDKRVIWEFEGGECQRGVWFANPAGEICFAYEGSAGSQCWAFLEAPDGRFHARLSGEAASEDLVTRDVGRDALDCPAPDIGV